MAQSLLKPREAAQILGVSYPTLKQWVYKGKLRTVKTPGGHHRIAQSELDRYLHRAGKKPGPGLVARVIDVSADAINWLDGLLT